MKLRLTILTAIIAMLVLSVRGDADPCARVGSPATLATVQHAPESISCEKYAPNMVARTARVARTSAPRLIVKHKRSITKASNLRFATEHLTLRVINSRPAHSASVELFFALRNIRI